MSTSDDYRAMAEECFRWARRALTEDKRQAYLDVARTWLEAASSSRLRPSRSNANPVDPQSEALKLVRRTHSRKRSKQTGLNYIKLLDFVSS